MNSSKWYSYLKFAVLVANADVTFTLVSVNRKTSTKTSWETSDSIKYASQGGWDATDSTHNLNLWVCKIGAGILGYTQSLGGTTATNGILIGSDFLSKNVAGG